METKDYTINTMSVTWTELINKAKSLGYTDGISFATTSGAAAYLRERGYKIEYNIEVSYVRT